MLKIEIFSDTICPWCLVGKRRLERALAERPQVDLAVTWRAFQLNPDMPLEGMDRQAYLTTKFGGPHHAEAVYAQIRQAGQTEGIQFNFAAIRRTPNTVQSHRLIRFAGQSGRADAMVQALFSAYFFEGQNIGEADVLAEAGAGIGLDRSEVLEFLAGDSLTDEVIAEDAAARRAGITGVPCFVFNGRHALSGAHPPEVLLQLFDLARADDLAAVY